MKIAYPKRKILFVLVLLLVLLGAGSYFFFRTTDSDYHPLIGISVDTAWHAQIGLTTSTYKTALTRLNIRFITTDPEDSPEALLEQIDGLLLAGGGDVDPNLYGGNPQKAKLVDRVRDDFEMALIKGALVRDMPILGICRGIQILNVYYGGTLKNIQVGLHLKKIHGSSVVGDHSHTVNIESRSLLSKIEKTKQKRVNSWHGQAVAKIGNGLRVVARSKEGEIEGVEEPNRRFLVAVQWHPEILQLNSPKELAIFEKFLEAVKEYQKEKNAPSHRNLR